MVDYAGSGEDVIRCVLAVSPQTISTDIRSGSLRTEQEPYTGLIDCGKKIVEEEGWGALYHAWWWTMLGLAFI